MKMRCLPYSSYLRIALGVILVALPDAAAYATLPINTDAVRKSIVFIYAADSAGQPDMTSELATGFLVAVPVKSDSSRSFVLLVTARHVVDPEWACEPRRNPQLVYLRLNKRNYDPEGDLSGVEYVPLLLVRNGVPTWSAHPDAKVDAVVIPVGPDQMHAATTDVEPLVLSDFATGKELKEEVTVGDSVLSAGLVPKILAGTRRNYPVFKFGHVSSILEEPMAVPCPSGQGSRSKLIWLVAGNFVGGNSGSPVFLVPAGFAGVGFGGPRGMLIGVLVVSVGGADIGGMTPIQYVFETIERLNLRDADLYRGSPENRPKPAAPTKPE